MELSLNNKQVIVTGGTRGIGLSIAQKFLEEGAILHLISRTENPQLLAELNAKFGPRVFHYCCDITQEKKLGNVSEAILKKTKETVNILVVNVGHGAGSQEAIGDTLEWNRIWDLNFNSALYSTIVFQDALLKNSGNIIFISSIAGIEMVGAPTAYATAKSAMIALSKNLSVKLAPHVRVNVIAPGNIYFKGGTWDLKVQENKVKVEAMLDEKVPLKTMGTPEDIANAVVFLASDRAKFITGACLTIDGGQTTGFK